MKAALAELDDLRVRIDNAAIAISEEDAARYHFLRDSDDPTWRPIGLRGGCSDAEADAIVDAAMRAMTATE